MRHRSRFLGAFTVVTLGLASAVGIVAASPAGATTITRTANTTLTGSAALDRLGLTTASVNGVDASATIDSTFDWSQLAKVTTEFDSADVRQGRALDPVDTYQRTQAGHLLANWSVNDLLVGWIDIGTVALSAGGNCDLRAGGAAYVCHLESPSTVVAEGFSSGSIYVKAKVSADITVTPQAIATLRTALFAGNPAGTANLALGESSVVDAFSVPCTATVGDSLGYTLGTLSTSPGISVQTTLGVEVGTEIDNPAYPAIDPNNEFLYPPGLAVAFPAQDTTTTVAMTGTGGTHPFGTVQESDVPPVADAGGPYRGNEGSAIAFDGSGSQGGCGSAATLHWEFSDGGTADGATPHHTFADDGTYSGTLTVTDDNGGSKTKTFPITVANVAPSVDAGAGANSTTDWGRPVSFAGLATDPSSVDQLSLQYTWDFGDGSPTANGPNASHTYATPAVAGYDATLTVCDKDGGCANDVRHLSVTKRDTTTTYTGDAGTTPGTAATLRASLVDEYGQPVTGRTVRFQVGTDGPFNSATNASGIATKSYTPTLGPGSYSGSSTFAGDSLYNPSSVSSTFKVAKQSWVIYFGDFLGRPGRTIDLRALLIDRSGNPLPGRTVTFDLGDQTASATTDVHGIATTSVRLNQRGGFYGLTSTWTPAGADATAYVGSSLTVPFLLLPR